VDACSDLSENVEVVERRQKMKATLRNDKIVVEFEIGDYDKDLIDFLELLEISNKSQATEKEIENLSEEIKRDWWNRNKERFIK
jgi:hypothetical protein